MGLLSGLGAELQVWHRQSGGRMGSRYDPSETEV